MDLSIVIPAWNEAANLAPLVGELRAALLPLSESYEILVVDGGSRDGTQEVARSLGCVVVEQRSKGYGGALREGFAASRGRFIATFDADLSHPPAFLAHMWSRREEADLIIASRYVAGGSAEMARSRAILSRILNRTFGELLSIPVHDISSGFRLYRREALKRFETRGRNFNVLQELLTGILARGGRVLEVPFHYRPRGEGSSHARVFRFGLSYLGSLAHLFFLRSALFRGEPAIRLAPYLLIVLLAVGAAYGGALRNGAVRWDDDWLVFENPALRSLDGPSLAEMFDPFAPRAHYGSQYEPLADLSYAIDGQLFGWSDPRFFHIQGILWHALTAALLFLLLNRHTRSAGVALTAALLFALHPVATEAVTWISGRRTAISAAFTLLAALAWLRYRQVSPPAAGGKAAYAAALAAAAAANLAKQSGLATPLILLLLDLTARRERRPRLLPLVPQFLMAIGFAALFYRVGVREGVAGPHPLGISGQIQSGLLALAYYARLTVFPAWLRPSYGLVFDPGSFRSTLLAGGAVGAALLLAVGLLFRRAPVAAFGLAAALVSLAPALTGLGTQFVAERYLYLPLAFAATAAAAGFAALARVGPLPGGGLAERALVRRRRVLAALLAVVLGTLGVATHLRSRVWRDDVTLWTDAAAKEPQNRVARRLLGRALVRRAAPGDLERAEAELREAARCEAIAPPLRGPSPLPFILGDLSLLCEKRGALDEAERFLYAALDAAPNSERALVQIGDFYLRRGETAKARAVYVSCAERDPEAKVVRARLADLDAKRAPRAGE